ncbi:AAA family ATPase [Pedobacter insulae]|nr:AAA family ATPase [Pedobacter insulae]
MENRLWKLGCRWGSLKEKKPLFYDLLIKENIVIGWVDKDYGKNNWVLLTNGETVLAFAEIKEERQTILNFPHLKHDFLKYQLPFDGNMFCYKADIIELEENDRFLYELQQGICKVNSIPTIKKFNELLLKYRSNNYMNNNILDLLKYKKQIILQGPPGTGKTRLAKEIARELLIEDLKNSFTEVDLLAIVKEKTIINTFTNYNSFEIVKIDSNSFKIYPKGAKLEYKVFFSDVIDCIKDFDANDLVKKYDKKGVGTYLVGIAKYVVDSLEIVRQQIIQFHPSYTYEDFVRGITVKPNPDGDGVLYEAENKTLGAFANEAFQNYKLSRKQVSVSVSDIELFDLFISDIKEKIADSDEQRFSLTDAVYLFEPDEKRFKYKGDNWIAHSKGLNMKFSELQKIIASNVTERAQVKQLDGVEELTKQHATYFIKVVEMFYEFKSNHSSNQTNKEIKTALKNYVLIVDEINRANLSSVLGELIYALEYRGESVDSMYAIDGNNKLILPPNLYIIGTMNTADRSVGHIDYAIRRRFAFVDVLPEVLEINDFDKDLFTTVAKLFVKEWDNQWESSLYLSPEFAPKDVMLGHSYFIKQYERDDSGNNINDMSYDFKMRVKYEIVPILREYVKDGILNEKASSEIDKIENAYPIL